MEKILGIPDTAPLWNLTKKKITFQWDKEAECFQVFQHHTSIIHNTTCHGILQPAKESWSLMDPRKPDKAAPDVV